MNRIVNCLLMAFAISTPLRAERVYEIFDLGTPSGSSQATAINEIGQVTGSYYTGFQGFEREAFRWQREWPGVPTGAANPTFSSGQAIENGTMTGLGTYLNSGTEGRTISEAGVVGGSTTSPTQSRPLSIDGSGSFIDYSDLAPNNQAWRLGDVIAIDDTTGRLAFEYGYTALPGDSAATFVSSLNGSPNFNATVFTAMSGETIVGHSDSDTGRRAVLWRPDIGLTDLHPMIDSRLGGVYDSYAVDVTSEGYIVGMSQLAPPGGDGGGPSANLVAAFSIGPGFPEEETYTGPIGWMVIPAPGGIGPPNVIDLGPVSRVTTQGIVYDSGVNAVNNYGHALGTMDRDFGEYTAEVPFLYRDQRQVFVQDLLPDDSDFQVEYVTDINDRGEIVGLGHSEAGQRAFLMRLAAPDHYTQGDSAWGSDSLLGANCLYCNLADSGCFVSSTAMLLSTFGYDVTPQQLNNRLTEIGNFTNGNMNFTSMPRTTDWGQQTGEAGLDLVFNEATLTGSTRDEIVDNLEIYIEQHGPVILRVPYYNSANQSFSFSNGVHAIVAYRVEPDGTVWVRNPGSSHSGTGEAGVDVLTLDGYIAYENNRRQSSGLIVPLSADLEWLTQKRINYATVAGDAADLRGEASSAIDFVLTDPRGRRFGFDPTANNGAGIFFNEIPDSTYSRNDPVVSPDGILVGDDTSRTISFILGDLIDGDYLLDVFSNLPSDWHINFGQNSRRGYGSSQYAYSGSSTTAGAAGSYEFSVTIVPEPTSVAMLVVTAFGIIYRHGKAR